MRKAIVCLIAVHVLFLPAFGQSPLPARHWALGELDSMARRGLVKGYPAGPLVVPAGLTRHEAASLVMRAVRGVAAAFQQAGGALERSGEGAPPVAEPEGRLEAPRQVRMEDLARLDSLERWQKVQGIEFAYSVQAVEAVPAERPTSGILRIQRRTPLLKETEIACLTTGQAAAIFTSYYRYEYFRLIGTVRYAGNGNQELLSLSSHKRR